MPAMNPPNTPMQPTPLRVDKAVGFLGGGMAARSRRLTRRLFGCCKEMSKIGYQHV
jgi:hypothetical protein